MQTLARSDKQKVEATIQILNMLRKPPSIPAFSGPTLEQRATDYGWDTPNQVGYAFVGAVKSTVVSFGKPSVSLVCDALDDRKQSMNVRLISASILGDLAYKVALRPDIEAKVVADEIRRAGVGPLERAILEDSTHLKSFATRALVYCMPFCPEVREVLLRIAEDESVDINTRKAARDAVGG